MGVLGAMFGCAVAVAILISLGPFSDLVVFLTGFSCGGIGMILGLAIGR